MLTLPNVLSISRGMCAPLVAIVIWLQWWEFASALFLYAVFSDLIDGPIARKSNQVTSFGGRLDHTADALFVFSGLSALAILDELPWTLAIVQLGAFIEYAFYGQKVQSPLRMSQLGRINGILYFVLIGFVIFQIALNINEFNAIATVITSLFAWTLIGSTLLSILIRVQARRVG